MDAAAGGAGRGSRHVVATTSDHDIQGSQPQLVVDEVTAVVRAVRAGSTTLVPV